MIHLRVDSQVDYDVAVIGGGPAGSSAAYYLSRAGLNVVLLDRHFFPREKVCGDFIGPLAMVELQRIGIADSPEYKKSNIIRYAAVHLNGKRIISRSIPQVNNMPAYGRVIPRVTLDTLLLTAAVQAGARCMEGNFVTGYQSNPDYVELTATNSVREIRLRAKLLIGADGSNSIIGRQLRGSPSAAARIISVRAYFENVEGEQDEANLYFSENSFPGYYWLFPTGRRKANVGVGMLLDTVPASQGNLRDLLVSLIENDAALNKLLKNARMCGKIDGWPLTTYNHQLTLIGDRVMLTGDAAGLINPLNGEGIQYALMSGRIAAEFAIEHINEDLSKDCLSAYVTRIEREVRYDMALSNIIVQLIRNRSLAPVWLQALKIIVSRARIDYDYAEKVGGILAGLVPAHDALTYKVISGTIEQAATSLGIWTLWTALGGPRHLVEVAAGKASSGAVLLNETIKRPFDAAEWGLRTSVSALELAGQVAKSLMKTGV